MDSRIVVLGAGFGGLELATTLSEALGDDVDVTLIDKSDAFVFGFSKLDVMFGRTTPEAVRLPYRDIAKPGRALPAGDGHRDRPETRAGDDRPGRPRGRHLVVALGADYDMDATPGLAEGGNEFYSVAGAERLRDPAPAFTQGKAVIGVCGAPFKCPPAPSEAALLLHDYLRRARVRDACEISFVIPFGTPVPPSPDTSAALVEAFAERDIEFVPNRRVASLDPARRVAVLDDGSEMPFDLFLGVPKHRAPDVVLASGMAEDGYIPVDSRTLQTRFPDVYAVGDVATVGVPKAGVFAEGAARVVAESLIAAIRERRAAGRLRRARLLLHRVRRRAGRAGRRRLPLRPEADRHLPGALGGPRRREGALRLQSPRALVLSTGEPIGETASVQLDRPAVTDALAAAGCIAPAEEAAELIAAAGGEAGVLEELLARRCTGEPIAWLTGSTRFCGIDLHVEPGAYVPRWQTEPLARRAAALLPAGGIGVDLCTGVGPIAATMRAEVPTARVLGTELDGDAARSARRNGIEVLEGDLDDPLPAELEGCVDVLAAVVPYVPSDQLGLLPRDVRAFEPRLALDGGAGGMVILEQAVRRSPRWLRPGGWLLLELGGEQAGPIGELLREAGFDPPEVLRDEEGDPRGICARLKLSRAGSPSRAP